MRKRSKGIMLHRETLYRLERRRLGDVAGGTDTYDTCDTCARSQCEGSCMNTCYPSGCASYCPPCY